MMLLVNTKLHFAVLIPPRCVELEVESKAASTNFDSYEIKNNEKQDRELNWIAEREQFKKL